MAIVVHGNEPLAIFGRRQYHWNMLLLIGRLVPLYDIDQHSLLKFLDLKIVGKSISLCVVAICRLSFS